MDSYLTQHHGEILILVLTLLVIFALLILVPQLLRAHLRKSEMFHVQQLKALENGLPTAHEDERARMAGRTAMLVPMVVMITAGTVTCFVSASNLEQHTAVVLTVWVVSGIVSLTAITGGVALIGRLAQLQADDLEREEEELPANPLDRS